VEGVGALGREHGRAAAALDATRAHAAPRLHTRTEKERKPLAADKCTHAFCKKKTENDEQRKEKKRKEKKRKQQIWVISFPWRPKERKKRKEQTLG
jgi:hypothetical protein